MSNQTARDVLIMIRILPRRLPRLKFTVAQVAESSKAEVAERAAKWRAGGVSPLVRARKGDAGYRMQDTRYRMQDAGCRMQDAGYMVRRRRGWHPVIMYPAPCIPYPASCIPHLLSCILYPASCILHLVSVHGLTRQSNQLTNQLFSQSTSSPYFCRPFGAKSFEKEIAK